MRIERGDGATMMMADEDAEDVLSDDDVSATACG